MNALTERQLHLFKSKRQRGVRADYSPSEFELHCAVADTLRRWAAPDWIFSHLPFGEYRTKATAARLKRMGVVAGWPDFILMPPTGLGHFLELKRARGGTLSDAQSGFAAWCAANGVPYAVVKSFDEALTQLKAWGAVRTGIEVSA
jgi:hypothetical protein